MYKEMKREREREDKICRIARFYGEETQSNQFSEEAGELLQAINKLRRAKGIGQPTNKSIDECERDVIEELADVLVMVKELIYLHCAKGEVEEIIDRKLEREMKRMVEIKNE